MSDWFDKIAGIDFGLPALEYNEWTFPWLAVPRALVSIRNSAATAIPVIPAQAGIQVILTVPAGVRSNIPAIPGCYPGCF